jgi:hypothetical protein
MFGGMALDAPTAAVLVAAGIIVVSCVVVSRVSRTLLGIVDALDALEGLFYVLCALVIVAVVSWAMVYALWRLLSGVL